jgi:hypothetical protein
MKGKPLKTLIVELDLTQTSSFIYEDDINEIIISYYNWSEGMEWQEPVPFKILKADYINEKVR